MQFSILAMLRRSRPVTINALATAMVMNQTTLGTSCRWGATVHEAPELSTEGAAPTLAGRDVN